VTVYTKSGFYHLMPTGWIQSDLELGPQGVIQTWHYRLYRRSTRSIWEFDLMCKWTAPNVSGEQIQLLKCQFGRPFGYVPDTRLHGWQ